MFKNMSIKFKLISMVTLPLIFIMFLVGDVLYKSYIDKTEVDKLKPVIKLSTKIGLLIHETQKERGMTAGYIGSKGKRFSSELPEQRKLTTQRKKELKEFMTTFNISIYNDNFKNSVSNSLVLLDKIDNKRELITQLKISGGEAIGYYTSMNTSFLEIISNVAKISSNAKISQEVTAYIGFLMSKENAGIERAVGSNTFARDNFGQGMRVKFNSLIAFQDSYLNSFNKMASFEAKEFYLKKVKGEAVNEVKRMREVALESKNIGGFGVDSAYWFDTITKKINKLKQVEDFIASSFPENEEPTELDSLIFFSTQIANMIHETQKERGATGGFIGSKGKKFITKLPNQRKLTDTKRQIFRKALVKYTPLFKEYPEFENKLKIALKELDKIENIRSSVSNLDINGGKALGYYTKMNGLFIDTISILVKYANSIEITRNINSYINFLYSKERAGIERAVLTNTFANNIFRKGVKEKLVKLISEQNSFLKVSLINSDKKVVDFIDKTMKGHIIDEVERMRTIALNTDTIGGFNIDPSYWFSTITKKINILKEVEDFLAEELNNDINDIESNTNSRLFILSIMSVFILLISFLIVRNISSNIINNLSIFQEGLLNFFKYLNHENNKAESINIDSKDELGIMSKAVNENIHSIETRLEQDNILITEVREVANKVKQGHFDSTIKSNTLNKELNDLKDVINLMIQGINENITNVSTTLESFSKFNYTDTIETNNLEGYKELNSNIQETVVLIEDVSNASREQNGGIGQINDAVSMLDKQAQENSAIANETQDISNQTAQMAQEIVNDSNEKEFFGK